ncbi:unnamed protein product [Hydatigera taeniaeformis]|uniref:Uncharacterized protein n=1 Tax=Hydatigena taeniaeformis TaxID=6205 RepID=A0A0R3X7F1_HYDTA|nr:unnamed protein product [Hydatigera taeniaeformis]
MDLKGGILDPVSNFDDDVPVSLTFKVQTAQRSKSEKEANSFIQTTRQKARARRRARQMVEYPRRYSTSVYSIEKAVEGTVKSNVAAIETSTLLPKLELSKSKTKRNCIADSRGNEDEFGLMDTFDFRKYLPQNFLGGGAEDMNSFDENDAYLGFEEKELGNAILKGGFAKDPEESCHGTEEQDEKMILKKKQSVILSKTPGVTGLGSIMKKRLLGSRHNRKQNYATQRIVILSQQDTASLIHQRADAFVNQRLFDTVLGVGKPFRTPSRMSPQDVSRMAAKLKARKLARQGF